MTQLPHDSPAEGPPLVIVPAASLAGGMEWLAKQLRGRTEGPVRAWTTFEAPVLTQAGQPTGKTVRLELRVFATPMGPRRGARIAIFDGQVGDGT